MKQEKILHICPLDKFIPPFIEFMERNFAFERHVFVLIGDLNKFPVQIRSNIIHLTSRTQYFFLLAQLHQADKIILHSIFDRNIVKLLSIAPWLLSKCYWVMWGGDLYHYQFRNRNNKEDRYEKTRARVIRKMGHFLTYVKGDYELVQKWYGAKGQYHECLMYPSNLYKEYVVPPKKNGKQLCVLLGNSADPSNNHDELFEKLLPFKDESILIYCPLSYGQAEYADHIAKLGKRIFGDKFIPLLDFIPFEKYLELLGEIDIAVFAHKRQQAMGNTITLLGLGKKVYMRNNVTSWSVFANLGVSIFNIDQLDTLPLGAKDASRNKEIISRNFSESKLKEQLEGVFQ